MSGEMVESLNRIASVGVVANTVIGGAIEVFKRMESSLVMAVRGTLVVRSKEGKTR